MKTHKHLLYLAISLWLIAGISFAQTDASDPIDQTQDPNSPEYNPALDPNSPEYNPALDPNSPEYNPALDPNSPEYNPTPDPNAPEYNPTLDPNSPEYNPALDPNSPEYNPTPDPNAPVLSPNSTYYNPALDPNSPEYNPALDPNSPEYNPALDPNSPEYNPALDPNSPEYNPTPDPNAPVLSPNSTDYNPALDPNSPEYNPALDPSRPEYNSTLENPEEPIQFPQSVIDSMTTREGRYHHFFWHYIRDNWNRFDATTQQLNRDRGWEPPRPARRFDENGNPIAITDNNSGEDFLYFHRQMIQRVREIAGDIEFLRGWSKIPAPGDPTYPVPEAYTIDGSPGTTDSINQRKTEEFYNQQIVPLEELFSNPDQLRSMTLGELGSRIENTIHNWLHLRFSAVSELGYRPPSGGPIPFIDRTWDNPAYAWLGDTYSSHVNPIFWKLHGWVDDRIEVWREANGIGEIGWVGTWEGGPMSGIMDIMGGNGESQGDAEALGSSEVGENTVNSAEEPPPIESTFADDVQVDLGATAATPNGSI